MGAEINVLDWWFAAGQGLFGASFFYFLYLIMRFSRFAPIICDGFQRRSDVLARQLVVEDYRYFSME